MELRNYIEMLRRRRWIIAATVIIAVVVMIIGIQRTPPTYTAGATLRLTSRSGTNIDWGALEYAVRLKNTYAQLAASSTLLAPVQEAIGGVRTIESLRGGVRVEFPANNELMTVVVVDLDPVIAATVANEVAAGLIDDSQRNRSSRAFLVEMIDPAVPPSGPDAASLLLLPLFGTLVSLIAGIGLAMLIDNLDTTIHSRREMTALASLPLLGSVPSVRGRASQQCFNGNSPEGDAFRQLRTNLAITTQDAPLKTIAITSAEPGEGKSLIAANLAYSLAQLGQKVVLVDGDLRVPSVHRIFGLSNDVGLADLLTGKAEIEQAVRYVADKKVSVLTSGKADANPADLLSAPALEAVLDQLAERFDVVVMDSPAYLAVADSTLITTLADGVVFIVRYEKSRKEHVQAAYDQMKQAEINLIGVVANGAEQSRGYQYYRRRSARA